MSKLTPEGLRQDGYRIELSPLEDDDVFDLVTVAFEKFEESNPIPRGAYADVYRVAKADHVHGLQGQVILIIMRKNGKPWGWCRFEEGKVLPGRRPRTRELLTIELGGQS